MRDLKLIIGILALCLLVLFVVHSVTAIETDTTPTLAPIFVNSTSATMTELVNHTYPIYRISQGDAVYLGDHLDISGVVAGNAALVWFRSGEPDPTQQPYVIPLPDNKAGYYDWYVDPAIYSQMTGYIYKWNGAIESNGNTHAFRILGTYRPTTTNITVVSNNTTSVVIPTEPLLPEVHVADYLITQGDALNINVSKMAAAWIFNANDNSVVYEPSVNNSIIILNETTIQGLEPGRYKMIIQSIGNVSKYMDVSYAGNNTIKWFDRGLFQVHEINLNGMTPDNAIATLETIFPQTNDHYDKFILLVERPSITIESMDKVGVWAAKQYYRLDSSRGNVSLMDVRGYTNVLPGTNVSVVLDLDHTTPRDVRYSTFNGTAQGTSLGNKRYYQVFVPLYEDSLYVGMHSLTARTSIGGSMRADFPVTVMPADSHQDNVTVKWVGNASPWVPPVTVTVTIPVPGPTRIVTVTITPDQNQLNATALAQQRIVAAEQSVKNTSLAIQIFAGIGVVTVLFFTARFIYRTHKRKKWMQK